jgi:hypothetical protein
MAELIISLLLGQGHDMAGRESLRLLWHFRHAQPSGCCARFNLAACYVEAMTDRFLSRVHLKQMTTLEHNAAM